MDPPKTLAARFAPAAYAFICLGAIAALVVAGPALRRFFPIVPMTLDDFHVPGTQVGDVPSNAIDPSDNCMFCHSDFDEKTEPHHAWKGSLMGVAGRDPLFWAQMTVAEQDVSNVGYYCMRCHVPMAVVTGNVNVTDGSDLNHIDLDGVSCHLCHSMVDPIYTPGVSPPGDEAILAALDHVPEHYGNAMFVLDPSGTRRGPRPDAATPHQFIENAEFIRSSNFCGTCHDVGNVAVTRQFDGTYRYNRVGEPSPTDDPIEMFPLERTFTEWRLSAFADGGVDMGGRFGGDRPNVVSSCQDCHMPTVKGRSCFFGPEREDLATHEFAGASAWVLDIIALYYADDPSVDLDALADGRRRAVDMLERAATVELQQVGGSIRVRTYNQSGHKLPTGHIEGRRVWLNVKIFDDAGELIREYGQYDYDEAHLDEQRTVIYEMHVGLSEEAAEATGYQPGVTTHMALADTIEKDNRIPPRGFNNEAYAAAGAPVVGAEYEDGQHWADAWFALPENAASVVATVNYQTVTRHYIEALRDANETDHWGDTLHSLWEQTGKGPPIQMTSSQTTLKPFQFGDINGDNAVNATDLAELLEAWRSRAVRADLNGDLLVDSRDLALLLGSWSP